MSDKDLAVSVAESLVVVVDSVTGLPVAGIVIDGDLLARRVASNPTDLSIRIDDTVKTGDRA